MAYKYQTSIYLGMDPFSGKPINRRIGANTKAELNRKRRDIQKELQAKQQRVDDQLFGFYRENWLKIKKLEVGNGHYRCLVNNCDYLKRFDDIPIDRITSDQYYYLLSELAKMNPHTHKPSSKKILVDIRRCAYNIHETALKPGPYQAITYNVVKDVKIPKTVPPKKRTPITPEQRQWILETPHKCRTASMIMLYAGLRRGEVTVLTKDDIDLENKTIRVNKAAKFEGQKAIIGKPKTEAGVRIISIPDILVDYLSDQFFLRKYITFNTEEPYNSSLWISAWRSYMRTFKKKYGDDIETFTPHQLRHTYCTMLFDAGIDAETARNLMGHENISTTLDIYTHLSRTHEQKEISALNRFLSEEGTKKGPSEDGSYHEHEEQ